MAGTSAPSQELTCVHGHAFAVSRPDGDIPPDGAHGFYVRDVRLVTRLELLIDGETPSPLAGALTGSASAEFHAHLSLSDDRSVDPTLLIRRRRTVGRHLDETVTIDNRGSAVRVVAVSFRVASDLAYVFDVKRGAPPAWRPLERTAEDVVVRTDDGAVGAVLRTDPPATLAGDVLRWVCELEPGTSHTVQVTVAAGPPRPGSDTPVTDTAADGQPEVRCSDDRLTRMLRRSADDLRHLVLHDPEGPSDRFYAAGAPWYLTLFGRDALWSAFMTLPAGLGVAAGTLRALARRQGTRTDPATEEEPGRIVHEVRTGPLAEHGPLPPRYYGTVDATPLFILLLHEAWLWGLADEVVASLLPNLEAALGWMRERCQRHPDGFIGYASAGGRGLRNQGWKDSTDGIRFADGRIAEPPVALVEVQGYAHDAAVRGAELLERFGRGGADDWRTWARRLRERFHERYWVEDRSGPYLALALDGDGTPVDAPTSNVGHVLMSGLLDPQQASAVARRLADPAMNSGWGLRTMSTEVPGYNPLSYHCGSVWPHDTAIAAWGCATAGQDAVAGRLIGGLVAAGAHFEGRLPELFGGMARVPGGVPVPYPAACRPQAWSAAAAALLVRACLRPRPRLPDGRLSFAPLRPFPFRRLEVRDVPLGGGRLDLVVDTDRGADHTLRGADVDVRWESEVSPTGPRDISG